MDDILDPSTSAPIVDAAERWTSDRIRSWSVTLRENLAAWLQPNLDLVGDAEWGAIGRQMTGLGVGEPLDWANRRIKLADGEWAITGIRFRGGDLAKPFVDVIATSLPPSAEGLGLLAEILPHYADFAPLCLRANAPDPVGLISAIDRAGPAAGHAAVDLWIVAGRIRDLSAREPAAGEARVALEKISPDAAAARAAEIYAEIANSRPDIAEWAIPEDAESLSECAEEGLLFEVRVDGVPAGVAALARDDSFGLRGWCVHEICLDSEHRGRGLGPVVLRQLAGRLPTANDVLWGHIHPDNQASLRNALAAGREIVGAQLWLTPEGYPGMPG
ncbi:GNAT family N-acetyltransferase [Paramicrobacterium fandaimingii]|uniref:GNAT family N-acetyltransferase n=1 Tax=Paramicrobacterium fandaimingii TaxID=2708079 RepID=UPI0014245DFE|nr:GNAT family N-acetyltransferase [Microbacterium fandaimingii]